MSRLVVGGDTSFYEHGYFESRGREHAFIPMLLTVISRTSNFVVTFPIIKTAVPTRLIGSRGGGGNGAQSDFRGMRGGGVCRWEQSITDVPSSTAALVRQKEGK
jgi:hypothetical protein